MERPALILLYHRVADCERDPWALAVSPRHFGEQMEVLARRRPGRLARLAQGEIAVTFDDGYGDVVENAVPVLERHALPATFFVTTGVVDPPAPFWWDALEDRVLAAELPERFTLCIAGREERFEAGPSPKGGAGERSWRAWLDGAPSLRHSLYRQLWERCQPLSPEDREAVLATLARLAGAVSPSARRSMRPEELSRLARHPLFELGAHSVSHPRLSALPPSAQQEEIAESRRWLEDRAGASVQSFAYPFGGANDFDGETVRLVRQAGYSRACVNIEGTVSAATDPWRLPRLFVHDWNGEDFARKLDGLGL